MKKGPPRTFDWDEARRLRAAGMIYREIAERVGASISAVQFACNPEMLAANNARTSEFQRSGTCPECGAPATRHAGGRQSRCAECAATARQQHGMARYRKGCRCDVCRAASAAQKRRQRARHREHYRAYDRERQRQQRDAA